MGSPILVVVRDANPAKSVSISQEDKSPREFDTGRDPGDEDDERHIARSNN